MATDDVQILDESSFKAPQKKRRSDCVSYTLKIINPMNKSGVEVRKWNIDFAFTDISEMKHQLLEDVCACADGEELTFGYLQPGHGTKGRQVPLLNSSDLSNMYSAHDGRKQIILWVKISKKKVTPPPPKRQRTTLVSESSNKASNAAGSSRFSAQQQKMTELEAIVNELSERHGNTYTVEHTRAWAHMLQMKKHDSYEEPPQKPFFKTAKSLPSKSSDTMSPGKRIQYRSQCIEQLDKWHDLKKRGVITESQYAEMQDAILSDIKKF